MKDISRDGDTGPNWPLHAKTWLGLYGFILRSEKVKMPRMIYWRKCKRNREFSCTIAHPFVRSCLQLIVAFPSALKHNLRFEPYIEYDDMREYVEYLNTLAKQANEGVDTRPREYSRIKQVGQWLGIQAAESNPRKAIKRASKPLGNLPLEILSHIQAYLDTVVENGTLKSPVFSNPVVSALSTMNDILAGCDRILNTPLPLAYRIVISQITWLYVLTLPFQLYEKLGWKMIPATILASYIILGLARIGAHIENPFGHDVNDLPLDMFCEQIAHDIDVISSSPPPKSGEFMKRQLNKPLWPLSRSGYAFWGERSEEEIREALRMKVDIRHDRNRNVHFEYDGSEGKEEIDV
jgi:putative membrane protein